MGYILSEDPTYITTHNNARSLIRRIDRDELLKAWCVLTWASDPTANLRKRGDSLSEQKKQSFPTYKGKPLVRSGDTLYYGSMRDKYVIKMNIKSKKKVGDLEVADKVTIQLMYTDPRSAPASRS